VAQVRRRGPKRYLITVYLGRGRDGKRKYHNETFYGTENQARLYASELEVRLKRRTGPLRAAMNLGEYLQMWLGELRGSVTERTWETCAWHVRKLTAFIGHLELYNLTSLDLQRTITKPEELGVAHTTLLKILATLRMALDQAVAWQLIPFNPARGLLVKRKPRVKRRVLALEELFLLLDAAKGYRHYLALRLLAVTGMRLGELLGLKWADVDLDKGVITIRRSIDTRKRRFKPEGDETKTPAAERTIKLDPETVALLADLRKQRAKQKVSPLRLGDTLVFGDGVRPLGEDAIRRTLRRALKQAGLPRIRVHDLRHTAASVLIDAGVPVTTVAELLGHSTPATTMSVYAHPLRHAGCVVEVLRADKDADRRPGSQD